MIDIRKDVPGLWCDDITFCPEKCGWKDCPRNQANIRDRTVPHSFFTDTASDCPKRLKKEGELRVIDRGKVEKGLRICTSGEPCNGCPYLTERNCSLEMVEDALDLLKEQDARIEQLTRYVNGFSREAVPVVWCKDCKNGGMDSTSYPHYWCTRHTEYVRENYFCADGEGR